MHGIHGIKILSVYSKTLLVITSLKRKLSVKNVSSLSNKTHISRTCFVTLTCILFDNKDTVQPDARC
jgi:hypothetical protein